MENSFKVKQIILHTNFNNKLACSKFIHIAEAPTTGLNETLLQQTVVEISTKDDSHPPIKTKLVDLCRLPLYQLTDICTFQSHGMTVNEFVFWHERTNRNASPVQLMAIYYYEKI
jgi:hypothetical protein